MKLAIPVAVKLLHRGNKELSRNLSSYLSLAAINNAEILAPHVQPIIDSIIGGNYSLARVLPKIYSVNPDSIHDHIMALVCLLPLSETPEKISLLNLFSLISKTKPALLESNLPQLSECLLAPSTSYPTLQIFLDMVSINPDPFVEYIPRVIESVEHQSNLLSIASQFLGIIAKSTNLTRASDCIEFFISQLSRCDLSTLITLLREIKSIVEVFPILLPSILPEIFSQTEHSSSNTVQNYLGQLSTLNLQVAANACSNNHTLGGANHVANNNLGGANHGNCNNLTNSNLCGATFTNTNLGGANIGRGSSSYNQALNYRYGPLSGNTNQVTVLRVGCDRESAPSGYNNNPRMLLDKESSSLGNHHHHERHHSGHASEKGSSKYAANIHRSIPRLHLTNGGHIIGRHLSNSSNGVHRSLTALQASSDPSQRAPSGVQNAQGRYQTGISVESIGERRKDRPSRDATDSGTVEKETILPERGSNKSASSSSCGYLANLAERSDGSSSLVAKGNNNIGIATSVDSQLQQANICTNFSSCTNHACANYNQSISSNHYLGKSDPRLLEQQQRPLDTPYQYSNQLSSSISKLRSLEKNPPPITAPSNVESFYYGSKVSPLSNKSSYGTCCHANSKYDPSDIYANRDAIQHFCEKHIDKIKAYMTKILVKIPLPVKCTIEERKGKKNAKLHFLCQKGDANSSADDSNNCAKNLDSKNSDAKNSDAQNSSHSSGASSSGGNLDSSTAASDKDGSTFQAPNCLYSKTFYVMKTRNAKIWIHLMFLALQSKAPRALCTSEGSVQALKNCWDTLSCSSSSHLSKSDKDRSFLTLVTSSFPSIKDQDILMNELRSARYFDVFEFNAINSVWACFLCNHPDRAPNFVSPNQPVIQGQLKEKKGKWKLFRRWRTRYFTLSGIQLSYREAVSTFPFLRMSFNINYHFPLLSIQESEGENCIGVGEVRSVKAVGSSRGRMIPKAFEIFTNDDKTFLLKANNSRNTEQWVQCLSIAMASAQAKESSSVS